MAEIIPASDPDLASYAAALLSRGELVVYPTDTVYGLGAAASNEEAIRRLFSIKGRSLDKALPLLLSDASMLDRVVEEVSIVARKLIDRFWPGALTIVMRRRPGFRSLALAGQDTVGVRVSDESIVRDIIHTLGEPVTGTSANRSGTRSPASAQEAAMQLGDLVPLVIDGGPRPGARESTVVDVTVSPPRIVREGAVSRQELENVLGKVA